MFDWSDWISMESVLYLNTFNGNCNQHMGSEKGLTVWITDVLTN